VGEVLMKRCLNEETQQDKGLPNSRLRFASDGFHHVIKPQDWKVFSVRGNHDERRGRGEETFLD
jgi:hypothetical protein